MHGELGELRLPNEPVPEIHKEVDKKSSVGTDSDSDDVAAREDPGEGLVAMFAELNVEKPVDTGRSPEGASHAADEDAGDAPAADAPEAAVAVRAAGVEGGWPRVRLPGAFGAHGQSWLRASPSVCRTRAQTSAAFAAGVVPPEHILVG